MIIALVRPVPESIQQCELTHLERLPIDYSVAIQQHEEYVNALRSMNCTIVELPVLDDHPDSVFVEDAAVVFDEFAVITRPGAESRRGEIPSVEVALRLYRELLFIEAPGTLDGGDVIVSGRTVFAGRSSRTNDEGISQLRALVSRAGYEVTPVDFRGCLHLKSAATQVRDGLMLINPEWIDVASFSGREIVCVHPQEPYAANALAIGNTVLFPSSFPLTMSRLRRFDIDLRTVLASELAKAEGALTCGSLIVGLPECDSETDSAARSGIAQRQVSRRTS